MTESVSPAARAAYIDFWQTLTADNIDRLDGLVADSVRYVDPFNKVTGRDAFKRVLAGSLKHLEKARFTVQDSAVSGPVVYVRWRFDFTSYLKRQDWVIEGMTEVHFAADGRVTAHFNHWDSGTQFYRKLPLVGWLIRRIEPKLRHG